MICQQNMVVSVLLVFEVVEQRSQVEDQVLGLRLADCQKPPRLERLQ